MCLYLLSRNLPQPAPKVSLQSLSPPETSFKTAKKQEPQGYLYPHLSCHGSFSWIRVCIFCFNLLLSFKASGFSCYFENDSLSFRWFILLMALANIEAQKKASLSKYSFVNI